MDKVEIKWLKNPSSSSRVAQIYSSGLEYCFVSEKLEQCHVLVYCKDFLQDAVQASLHGKVARIYGFGYNPKDKPPLNVKKTSIAFANRSDNKIRDRIPHLLDFLNQFSKKLHLKQTVMKEVSNPPKYYDKCGVFLTEGSPRWMNSPPLLSMYTLLLRCGCAHISGKDCMETVNGIISGKVKPYQREDAIQLKSAVKGIELILKLGYRAFFYIDSSRNYPKETYIDTMHNSGGIVGFSSGTSKVICPYWHRKSLMKRLEK